MSDVKEGIETESELLERLNEILHTGLADDSTEVRVLVSLASHKRIEDFCLYNNVNGSFYLCGRRFIIWSKSTYVGAGVEVIES